MCRKSCNNCSQDLYYESAGARGNDYVRPKKGVEEKCKQIAAQSKYLLFLQCRHHLLPLKNIFPSNTGQNFRFKFSVHENLRYFQRCRHLWSRLWCEIQHASSPARAFDISCWATFDAHRTPYAFDTAFQLICQWHLYCHSL